MKPDALFLDRSNQSFNHAVLLRRMRLNKLLLDPIAPYRTAEFNRAEDQSVITSQNEWLGVWTSALGSRERRWPSRMPDKLKYPAPIASLGLARMQCNI